MTQRVFCFTLYRSFRSSNFPKAMKPLHRRSVIEQSAEHVREALRRGTWSGRLPGVVRLAADAGVSKVTMRAAMRLLEDEGMVELGENGYSRYAVARPTSSRRALRIGILLAEPLNEQIAQIQQLIIEIQHHLEQAGFVAFMFDKDLRLLRQDIGRISGMIAKNPVDACLVLAGSREVLEWFAAQSLPCLAIAGRASGLPIPSVGPDKVPAFAEAVRRLVDLGHRRIVLLNRKQQRLPSLGRVESAFFAELAAHGIEVGNFNLPDWEETPEGFHRLLAELFKVTPPTALVIDEVPLWAAAQQFLALNRILVPEQVSIMVADYDATFAWCSPPVTHIRWANEPIVRRIGRWAKGVKLGHGDLKQIFYPAEFVAGGSIGPAYGSPGKSS